jgi:hypothetical protein
VSQFAYKEGGREAKEMDNKDAEMVEQLIMDIMNTESVNIACAEYEKRVFIDFVLTPKGRERISRAFLRQRYNELLSLGLMSKCQIYRHFTKAYGYSVGKIQRICEGAGVGISDHRKHRNKYDQRLADRKKRNEYYEQWSIECENDPYIIEYAEAFLAMLGSGKRAKNF